jgi:hypothetical protein
MGTGLDKIEARAIFRRNIGGRVEMSAADSTCVGNITNTVA